MNGLWWLYPEHQAAIRWNGGHRFHVHMMVDFGDDNLTIGGEVDVFTSGSYGAVLSPTVADGIVEAWTKHVLSRQYMSERIADLYATSTEEGVA